LLRLDNVVEGSGVEKRSPLAGYAAEHWVRHAQFEDVASCVKGIEDIFDLDKPYFGAWRQLHDIDPDHSAPSLDLHYSLGIPFGQTPLYYAALCGFSNLVEQLVVKHPDHVNAFGGRYMSPALAALAGRHFELVKILHRSGSSLSWRGSSGNHPLHAAALNKDLEMIQALIDCGVDVNALNSYGCNPLTFATLGDFDDPRVVRLLLDHGTDPNVLTEYGTLRMGPLHEASRRGRTEIVRLLVEYGANVELRDGWGMTPLETASHERHGEIVKLLLEHRAK
jgi:ankyrin repeat protein